MRAGRGSRNIPAPLDGVRRWGVKFCVKDILVHACCAPCACVFDAPQKFFFNGDNFDTREEYDRRLGAMLTLAPDAVIEPYRPQKFENCAKCIEYRLTRCAEYARAHGFGAFTTTLTVSPHKNTAQINEIGRAVGAKIGIEFIELDLKRTNPKNDAINRAYGAWGGFARSVARSKELGLYRQNYCGCAGATRNG